LTTCFGVSHEAFFLAAFSINIIIHLHPFSYQNQVSDLSLCFNLEQVTIGGNYSYMENSGLSIWKHTTV